MSLSTKKAESGIPRTILNLLRNDFMKFICGPLVYRTIIHWGFAKPDGIRIIDHINDLKIGTSIKKKNFTKWLKDNKSNLERYSFSDFDITTLHDFLPVLCYDKIAQTGGLEYEKQTKDPNSVESLLKEIKSFRNEVSHEYAEALKDSHIDKMKETMRKCIRVSGKLYGIDQTEIDEKVKVLDNELDKVLHDTLHLYENRVKYISNVIETEVPAILLENSPHYLFVPMPCSFKKIDTSDIFQCCNLYVSPENNGSEPTDIKNIFSCTNLYNKKLEKFVVINGGPGSGKTTLMQNMFQDILQTSVHGGIPRYENIDQFKIPIYLECRSEQQTNLPKFFRECLKNFLSPEDDIYEAFKIVKGLVFLIDGYDEINSNCRQLVDNIIIFCREYNASCIVSSRIDAVDNFVNELQDKNLNCTKTFIKPISEIHEKRTFLKSYAAKMDDSIDTDKLVNSFENLTAAAQEIFSSPILLALFISLFVNDPNSVSKMKNEQSAYEEVRNSFLREITRKLRIIPNSRNIALDVVSLLGCFCLKLFWENKYFLEGKDYSNLVAECRKIKGMPEDVDVPSLLSCILTPEHSLKFRQYSSYQFMHSTIQESLAAKYVSENIRELQDDMSSQSQSKDGQLPKLLQVLKLDKPLRNIEKEVKRYGNIIKLLMLETLANGELSKYRNTFTQLLKRYFKLESDLASPEYYLDLILSSGSNADIISIVSECIRDWYQYNLRYYRHIKPMIEVMQTTKTRGEIYFDSDEDTNCQQIIKLLTAKEKGSVKLAFQHSYYNYQPLEEELYTFLKNSKLNLSVFKACVTSGEHLSIVVKKENITCTKLDISTPSVSEISFTPLEEFEGYLSMTVKYTDDCPSIGSNPVRWGTLLNIEHIPADGKEKLYNMIKYICPKSKKFSRIHLRHCHLTDTDANELLMKLHEDKIKTLFGERTEVEEFWVNSNKSRTLHLHLKISEEEKNEEEESEVEESEEEESEEEQSEDEESRDEENEEDEKTKKRKWSEIY